MDSDRELLEWAAKAAGHELDWEEVGDDDPDCGPCWFCVIKGTRAIWDPLTNDGDALRLAVKLRLASPLTWPDVSVEASEQWVQNGGEIDWYAATRRAIVRAAAEIGREPGGRNG